MLLFTKEHLTHPTLPTLFELNKSVVNHIPIVLLPQNKFKKKVACTNLTERALGYSI